VTAASALIPVAGLEVETLDLPGGTEQSPLVLLHEGLGSVGLWRGLPGELNRLTGRRTIAFSRFGHGRSAPPPRPRTPAFFHEEALDVLPELLERLEVREPVLVGHSDGASIALIYAAHHPVAALVLLAPHVFVEDVTVSEIRDTREQFLSGRLRERMARHHEDPDAAFRGWCEVWLDPAFRAWTLDREADQLTAPTLLIQGADDPYGSLAQLDRIQAHARAPTERLVLPGGHSPHLDHPERVREAIADFVSTAASHTID
jgi:pimeloyl-ACP methyl ester carboxylesterase